jgi:hypothetical protein
VRVFKKTFDLCVAEPLTMSAKILTLTLAMV